MERISILKNSGSDLEGQIGWLEEIRYKTELNAPYLYNGLYKHMVNLPDVYDAFMHNLEKHLPHGLKATAGAGTRQIISDLNLTAKAMINGDNLPALWMATLLSCHFSLVELAEDRADQQDVALRSRCSDLLNWARCFRSFSLPSSSALS